MPSVSVWEGDPGEGMLGERQGLSPEVSNKPLWLKQHVSLTAPQAGSLPHMTL